MPQFNTTYWVKCISPLTTFKCREHSESPNHAIHLACHCPILPSTVSYARLLLVTMLKGELIAKPGHGFNWADPWNQRTQNSKMIYWRIPWINRSEIHAGVFTGKCFPPSVCVLSVIHRWRMLLIVFQTRCIELCRNKLFISLWINSFTTDNS